MDGLKTKQNMFSLPYMNEFVLVCFKIKFLKDWLWRPPVLLVGWYWHCETNFSPTFSKINELLFGAKYLEIKCQIWICMCIVSGGGGPSFFIFKHFPLSTIFKLRYIVVVNFIGKENHRPAASHKQTLSLNVVPSTPRHVQGSKSKR
jgi:hypothetical protein